MDWLTSIFPANSVAYTVVAYSLAIVGGLALGKIRIKGISLGSTFVLFVGLLLGHFHVTVPHETLHFIKEFGLILFIFSIGLQVGPGFFSSFKQGGVRLNLLATLIVVLGAGIALAAYYLQDSTSLPMMVGVMSGGVTNTPGLGAAQEALNQLGMEDPISLGYAVAYPMGVLGTILVLLILRGCFRINTKQESEEIEKQKDSENTADRPDVLTYRITNEKVDGMRLLELKELFGHNVIATRIFDGEKMFVPSINTVLHKGYIIRLTTRDANVGLLTVLLGEQIDYEWEKIEGDVVSRRIVVTQSNINGKTLRQLDLRSTYHVNVTRVHRAGVDLIANPNLALQVGDRVMVVGTQESIAKVESFLGNTLKRLNEPHLFTIFVGILLGILVGSIPIHFPNMPMPAKLGLAGGPLIVAILLGRFGYKLRLITYTTQSANLMLRELGLCLFLASVGLSSGGQFVETVISPDGLMWIGIGLCITMIPTLLVGVIARFMKINYLVICGLIAGSHTNPPTLGYSNTLSETDAPAVAYSTVYPLTMFLRIIIAQFMILFFV